VKILGISGSVRHGSHNRTLLRAAANELPPGVELEELDGLAELPGYDEDLDGGREPEAVVWLRDSIARADAVLIATPEYNGSIPGTLKNALDWASRPWPDNPLRGKPVAVVGASTGLFGAIWAQAELRKVLNTIGAVVVDRELPVGQADDAFDEGDRLRDPDLRSRLGETVAALLDEATEARSADSASDPRAA
jgi:chromate reductase, NAD(P)H dehydrogenase (quinone)